MSGEILEGLGSALALIAFMLSIIVTAGILTTIDAGIVIWFLYIVEMVLLVAGLILQAIGEHL